MNQIEIDKPKIIDYITRINPCPVRHTPEQDAIYAKLAQDVRTILIDRKIEVLWRK